MSISFDAKIGKHVQISLSLLPKLTAASIVLAESDVQEKWNEPVARKNIRKITNS